MNNNQINQQDLQDEISLLKMRIRQLEDLLDQATVPVIPSIIPDTILIPFSGELSPERSEAVVAHVLNRVSGTSTDTVILDFTGLILESPEKLVVLGKYVEMVSASLNLMGIQVIIVGFSPRFAQEVVWSGLPFVNKLKSFATFKTALQYLLKEKRLAIVETD